MAREETTNGGSSKSSPIIPQRIVNVYFSLPLVIDHVSPCCHGSPTWDADITSNFCGGDREPVPGITWRVERPSYAPHLLGPLADPSLASLGFVPVSVGCPGRVEMLTPADRASLRDAIISIGDVPVFLPNNILELGYEEFAMGYLDAALHYTTRLFLPHAWNAYVRLNRIFADTIVKCLRPNDVVWVHDFALMLVPAMLRARTLPSGVRIGYFHHAQFPSSEVVRCIPPRAVLLAGALGADVVGFHHFTYGRYFTRACTTLLPDCQAFSGGVEAPDGRLVQFSIYPGGIDVARHKAIYASPPCSQLLSTLRDAYGHRTRIVVCVSSLDESQGAQLVLAGYEAYLEALRKRDPKALRGDVGVATALPVLIIHVASPARGHLGLTAATACPPAPDPSSTTHANIGRSPLGPPDGVTGLTAASAAAITEGVRHPIPNLSAVLKLREKDVLRPTRNHADPLAATSPRAVASGPLPGGGALTAELSCLVSPPIANVADTLAAPAALPMATSPPTGSGLSHSFTSGSATAAAAHAAGEITLSAIVAGASALATPPDPSARPPRPGLRIPARDGHASVAASDADCPVSPVEVAWDAHGGAHFSRFVRGSLAVQQSARSWWHVPDLSEPNAGATSVDVPVLDPLKIRERVARLNGKYGGLNYAPAVLLQSPSLELSVALCAAADVNVCLPVREGLSVTPQYAIVAQGCANSHAPVVLSDFCGSESLLPGCLPVNPFDSRAVAVAIGDAIAMPPRERRERHATNMAYISTHGVREWVRRVLLRALPSATPAQHTADGVECCNLSTLARRRPDDYADAAECDGSGLAMLSMSLDEMTHAVKAAHAHAVSQRPLDVDDLKMRFARAKRRVLVFAYTGTLVRETVLESCWPSNSPSNAHSPPRTHKSHGGGYTHTTTGDAARHQVSPITQPDTHGHPVSLVTSPSSQGAPTITTVGRSPSNPGDAGADALRAAVAASSNVTVVVAGSHPGDLTDRGSPDSVVGAYSYLGPPVTAPGSAPISPYPSHAHPAGSSLSPSGPSEQTKALDLLRRLVALPNTDVYVLSGRSYDQMRHSDLASVAGLGLAAEWGTWVRWAHTDLWEFELPATSFTCEDLPPTSPLAMCALVPWLDEVDRTCRAFEERIPGSRTERKCASVTWHYGGRDRALYGESSRAAETARDLEDQLRRLPRAAEFQTILTERCLEVRPKGASKGRMLQLLMCTRAPGADFLMCVGDDRLDQDMIDAATLLKLGVVPGAAPSLVPAPTPVIPALSVPDIDPDDTVELGTSYISDPAFGDAGRTLVTTFHPSPDMVVSLADVCTVSVGRLNVRRAEAFVDNPSKLQTVLASLLEAVEHSGTDIEVVVSE